MSKGKAVIVWILIILLLGVIGCCGYQIYDRLNGNNTETKENKTEEKKEEKKDEVKELTDEEAKKDVLDKLNLILGLNCSDEYVHPDQFSIDKYSVANGWLTYCDSKQLITLFENDLSRKNKFSIVLSSIPGEKVPDSQITDLSDEAIRKLKQTREELDTFAKTQELFVIKVDDVKAKYKELFNEDLTSFDDIELYGNYGYYYDSVDNVYYKINCVGGGTGPLIYALYINNIVRQDKEIDVYMNIVAAQMDGGPDNSLDIKKFNNYDELSNFKVDESNYKEFKNYKLTFIKNNSGTYSYQKTEKVK